MNKTKDIASNDRTNVSYKNWVQCTCHNTNATKRTEGLGIISRTNTFTTDEILKTYIVAEDQPSSLFSKPLTNWLR